MTIMSSGISMYAMGLLLNLLLGSDFNLSMWICAGIVLVYILLGGLTSAIYNEVLQFFLIVFGFASPGHSRSARRGWVGWAAGLVLSECIRIRDMPRALGVSRGAIWGQQAKTPWAWSGSGW
jgi:hypothetical protein